MSAPGGLTRRGFVGTLMALCAALFLRPAAGGQKLKKLAVGLDKAEKLTRVGGWEILKIKGRDVLFVRDGERSVRALDPICTHEKCLVAYEPKDGRIHCACHKSDFALDGRALAGPTHKPLTAFAASLDGDRIIVTLPFEEA